MGGTRRTRRRRGRHLVTASGGRRPLPSPRRSTSMPTEPEVEDLTASSGTLDEQIVALAMDRVPFGLAIFNLDGRLARCNRTWAGFFEHYFGSEPGHATPGRHITELIPENADAIAELFDAISAGKVVRQAAHPILIPGFTTYWDVLFAPLYQDGRVVGAVDIVADATDRVRNFEQLERRIAAFTCNRGRHDARAPFGADPAPHRAERPVRDGCRGGRSCRMGGRGPAEPVRVRRRRPARRLSCCVESAVRARSELADPQCHHRERRDGDPWLPHRPQSRIPAMHRSTRCGRDGRSRTRSWCR